MLSGWYSSKRGGVLRIGIIFLILANRSMVSGSDDIQKAKDTRIVETLLRLKNIDVQAKPKLKAAVLRHLATLEETSKYLELIERFAIDDLNERLLEIVLMSPDSNDGVHAARLLLQFGDVGRVQVEIDGKDEKRTLAVVLAVGLVASKESVKVLQPLVAQEGRSLAVRSAAVTAVGRHLQGQKDLLAQVIDQSLPSDLNFAVANVLLSSPDPALRQEAAKFLKLPATKDAEPLPTVAELVQRTGQVDGGLQVFRTVGTCSKCHQVRGEGKQVGPDLSEIGSKLSPEAMYVSILDPSAGISHNYENQSIFLADGTIVSGIVTSKTDAVVTLRTAEAIERKIPSEEIEEMVKQKISLMPAELQKNMSVQNLVDLVEYLMTLKKK